jgi:hypothetical protein
LKAIVNKQVCFLHTRPSRESSLTDEVLYGMVVELLEEAAPGWWRVRTHYRYEGFAAAEDLLPEKAEDWERAEKIMVLNKNQCDVLSEPRVQGYPMQTLPRGALEAAITCLNRADLVAARDGMEAGEGAIYALADRAVALLDDPSLDHDGYYAFVCEKCAPTLEYYGYFDDARRLKEEAERIYAGA